MEERGKTIVQQQFASLALLPQSRKANAQQLKTLERMHKNGEEKHNETNEDELTMNAAHFWKAVRGEVSVEGDAMLWYSFVSISFFFPSR